MALGFPYQRCEMKTPTSVAELHNKLRAPSTETIASLRLLTAFLKLAPRQRSEVIALVERLATDPAAASGHSFGQESRSFPLRVAWRRGRKLTNCDRDPRINPAP